MQYKKYLAILIFCSSWLVSFTSKFQVEDVSMHHARAHIECQLSPDEILFQNSLQFTTNSPSVQVTKWFALKEPHTFFDAKSKKNEPAYSDSVVFTVVLDSEDEIPSHTVIHMFFKTNTSMQPQEKVFPLSAARETTVMQGAIKSSLSLPEPPIKNSQKSTLSNLFSRATIAATAWIQDKELPLVFKFILAFIIGLIMSLTPCIYPMIPITMGILHANKAHSFLRGFLLASSYTAGLSMTFAILGMLAAYGGAQFGSLIHSLWVVIPLVVLFVYLGFSMLGFYEMYIPRFMQPRHGHKNTGSLFSAFTFGMINGTVASPCLSPGLALILGIVTGLANPVLGLLLLFVFGVGSSFPLLIIGTFSSSLHILPRAGLWMIEFKKVFGFLLLGMSIYYLKYFMAEWLFYIALGLYIIIVASYYLYHGFLHRSSLTKFVGVMLCIVAAFTLTESYRVIFRTSPITADKETLVWQRDYKLMRTHAITQNKLLLLDFTADSCSLCKKLEREFFSQPVICKEFPKYGVPVKIDCTDIYNADCVETRKKFGVIGNPTIVLVNPTDESLLQKWHAELNDIDPQDFIQTVQKLHHKQ